TETLERLANECFTTCREHLSGLQGRDTERQKEIASLVALIHEAVAAVAGDATVLQTTISQSTHRFPALIRINDIGELKRQTMSEVVALKQISAERQKSWDSTLGLFKQRVAGLEKQLAATKIEASIDPLTHVANRGTFDRTCHEWTRATGLRF